MPSRETHDDPRNAGGGMFDAGGPHDRGMVMFDSRRAVLVEKIETAVAHTTRHGVPAEDKVALVIEGRINRPPDDATAAERPAERVSHLHMLSWDAVADLICDLHSLAARDGTDLEPALQEKWAAAKARGLTRRAA
jgi:hypothetical protein